MKRQQVIIGVLIVILCITCVMLIFLKPKKADEPSVSRALAAKMLALTRSSQAELAGDSQGNWYDPYIDTAVNDCGMTKSEDNFRPMDLLIYGEAQLIAEKFGVDEEALGFAFKDSKKDRSIVAADWFELYDRIIDMTGQVSRQELLILGTPANTQNLSSWQCLTGSGTYGFHGISLDSFMDANVEAYVRDNEIVAVAGISKNPGNVRNLWIISGSGQQMTAYIHGYFRTFSLEQPLERPVEKVMADLTFENQALTRVSLKTAVIKGEILSVGEGYVEVKNYGQVPVTEPFHVYRMYDGFEELSMDALEVGNKYTEFVTEGENICAALIRAKTDERNIRVVLSCDGFTGYEHGSVSITSSSAFSTVADGVRTDHAAGSVVDIGTDTLASGQSIAVMSSETAGKLTVNSLNRSQGHPSYRGTLNITNNGNGLVIVNELLLEEYLYAVLPSEMPAGYEAEALKTQAICARSFARQAMNETRFADYGADVDDSTATQVYNNGGEDERANAAVDATAGQVLSAADTLVKAYFYSTSCGSSASPDEVWLSGENPAYMQGRLQILGESERDFSSEDAFKAFMDDYASRDYFEKDISWFRWKVTATAADIKTAIDKSLLTRIRIVPSLITVKDESGNFVEREISTVGDIVNITVGERSVSGILKSVIVEGTQATIKITGEYNIRLLLAPVNSSVICDDGTDAGTMTMMPSGFFYIVNNADGSYTMRGGGYGHGAGMSQNGVQALAKRGLSCEEILKHYFGEAQIVSQ